MKYSTIILLLSTIPFGVACREQQKHAKRTQMIIVNLPDLSWVDTLKNDSGLRMAKFDYYLVKCKGFDSDEIRAGIDRFAKNQQTITPNSYSQYNMLYFKESEETNEKNLASDKNIIDAYSTKHDLIYEFVWNYNNLIDMYQYNNGLIVNPKSIIRLEDANHSVH